MEQSKKSTLSKMSIGALIGIANSLFGGGGGMLAVPLLTANGLQEKRAHATAILIILPISVFSFIMYAWHGFYQPSVAVPTALGVTLGGVVGAVLLQKLPLKTVRVIFALLQLAAGVFLFAF